VGFCIALGDVSGETEGNEEVIKNDTPLYSVGQIVCADWSHCSPFAEAKILKILYVENVHDISENGYVYLIQSHFKGEELPYKQLVAQGAIRSGERLK
jgi:hypothetical protein